MSERVCEWGRDGRRKSWREERKKVRMERWYRSTDQKWLGPTNRYETRGSKHIRDSITGCQEGQAEIIHV